MGRRLDSVNELRSVLAEEVFERPGRHALKCNLRLGVSNQAANTRPGFIGLLGEQPIELVSCGAERPWLRQPLGEPVRLEVRIGLAHLKVWLMSSA